MLVFAYPEEGSNAETSVYLNRHFLAHKNNFILYHIAEDANAVVIGLDACV